MTRLILPVILIGIAVGVLFMFTTPFYGEISQLKVEIASYNEALDNAKALEDERDKLTEKQNSILPENLLKLQKLLPENVDNVRLILEIEQIASPYGMTLKEVKYGTTSTGGGALREEGNKAPTATTRGNYGIFDLSFSTTGTYTNFINFIKDLEKNLRIVDISSITFSSDTGTSLDTKTPSAEVYKYNFMIKTYWLKN